VPPNCVQLFISFGGVNVCIWSLNLWPAFLNCRRNLRLLAEILLLAAFYAFLNLLFSPKRPWQWKRQPRLVTSYGDSERQQLQQKQKQQRQQKQQQKQHHFDFKGCYSLFLIILTYVRENAFCFKIQTSSNGTNISTTTTTTDISDEIVDVLLH